MIRLFEAFSGYGGASFALKKAKIDYQLIGWSDIKKAAIKCFERNHGGKNYGDITQINWNEVPDFDLLTGGFPCQDISQAGNQDLSKGRSILVYELIKALKIKHPKYFLFENVSAIEFETFRDFLSKIENEFRRAGYSVYRKCLNSKDFGVPQNRERVWFVGYRNDVAPEFGFTPWPVEVKSGRVLKDLLDDVVDEKYFLKPETIAKLFERKAKHEANGNGFDEFMPMEGFDEAFTIAQINKPVGISLPNATKCGFDVAFDGDGVRLDNLTSQSGRGRVQRQKCPTLLSSGNGGVALGMRVRRLTPKECMRLMGFQDGEIDLSGLSDSELYNVAGNGWDVNLVSMIFKRMFS